MIPHQRDSEVQLATSEDIRSILGEIDEDKIIAILAQRPTISELETALAWLSGDKDIFEPDQIKGVASEIVTILTEAEEDEPSIG